MRAHPIALGVFLAALLAVSGCSRQADTSARGTVLWKDLAVEKGSITFYPMEGTDAVRGAEIIDGKFHVCQLTPGRKRVSISIHPDMQAHENAKGEVLLVMKTPATTLAAIVEVQRGEQEIAFALGKK